MPELEPVPVTAREPVVVTSLVKLAVFAAAWAGIDLPEDNAAKIVAGVVALIVFVQATFFARSRVTPVARADAALAEARLREKKAYADGVAVGEVAAPKATVVEVAEVSDLDRILAALKAQAANPLAEPAPPAPPPPRPEVKPPAGLYVPDEPIITDTDGPGLPWAPTRQPPPPGLDG